VSLSNPIPGARLPVKPTRRLLAGILAGGCAALVAAAASPPAVTAVDLGGGVRMEFVLVPAGSYVMGSADIAGEEDEFPAHPVTISRPFYLGRCEVTQAQWQRVMGDNPSRFPGPQRPVDTVSWSDCQRFLARLAALTGKRFALPTEAQWEYAARAGTSTRWSSGDDEARLADYAWIGTNSGGATRPVATRKPNAWGLCDMAGNVWEWCADWYGKHAYEGGAAVDPTGPATGSSRILRGGGWGESPGSARPAYRNAEGPDTRNDGTGLRCVMLVDESQP